MNDSKNRLAGLISTKGQAPRPSQDITRAAALETPAPAASAEPPSPVEAPEAAAEPAKHRGRQLPATVMVSTTSLTLRLPADEYERLRNFAHLHRRSHQDVLSAALRSYLDKHE